MIEIENTIHIRQPLEDVFRFLADLENLPRWNYFVTQVRKLSNGPVGIGTTYHQIRKTDEQTLQIMELEPQRKISVKTISTSFPRLEMELIFEGRDSGTLVTDRWKLETGKPGILEKLATNQVRSAVHENLTKLKELLEEGRVILQDGRSSSLN